MAFVALYDASALYPAAVRDLLIRLGARRNLNLRVRWTDEILDEMLAPYGIEAQHPDSFVARLVELNAATVVDVIHETIRDSRRPPVDLPERLRDLRQLGLTRTVELLQNELR